VALLSRYTWRSSAYPGAAPALATRETLMSRLSVDTSLWLAGVFMFITGAGIGGA
jgi:hypothetical protein